MKIVNSKLNTLCEFLPSAVIFDKEDLLSQDKINNQRWIEVDKKIQYKQIATTEQIKVSFKKIVKAILIGNAVAAKGAEQKNSFLKSFYQNFSGIGYLLFSNKAEKRAHLFFAEPDTQTAISNQNLMFNKTQKPDLKTQNFNQIIIHVHGGGFVAMGTRSHQVYSRKWANLLNYPIFSIDYKKAPQNPYPEGLNDIWQAYNWILNNVSTFFNIQPQKIVFVGDSAGGNLIISLTLLCIKFGVRTPDGIVPIYPALNCSINFFTPSYLLSLDDQILPHMFLKMCINSYIKNDSGLDASQDQYISPILASEDFLKRFPKVRLSFGLCDPLNNDAFRFVEKLIQNGVDVKAIAYNDMPHGYLNYDVPGGMKYAAICVEDAAIFMKEILN
ncbi:hypothetical protein IMG5_181540 [Ichthyophthirius multifiliis]|uniref:Alpha/beta hydrolase fold-3 domain-containing protein n=1 Tax=Ichthyophthirius multifiliis TaxID=5932 RepID=G0R2V3_ICHMU|nr:hypothetical protein IMG5_181540 [Ichthyophthirius multifiliis]EGR28225.1 hypothetical protein IMG5_181540 [Ichthyophthirius multifiliis]|eukprot:XP_004027570.1 hypothetical protein IMG5_181540 [Ichthyophthirius multifiliis]